MRTDRYPWENSDGLVPILDDPSVWDAVFLKRRVRQVVKRVARKLHGTCPGSWTTVEVDSPVIGDMALYLMRSRAGRERFRAMYGKQLPSRHWHEDIANAVYGQFCVGSGSSADEEAEEFPPMHAVTEDRGKKRFLVPAKLREWLAGREVADTELRPLAFFGCAFAILQPEKSGEILQALADKDPRLAELLCAGESTLEDRGAEKTDAEAPRSEDFTTEASSAVPRSDAGLLTRLHEAREQASRLADELQSAASEMSTDPPLTTTLTDSLTDYLQTVQGLREELQDSLPAGLLDLADDVRQAQTLGRLQELLQEANRREALARQAGARKELVELLSPISRMRWQGDGAELPSLTDLRREAADLLSGLDGGDFAETDVYADLLKGQHRLSLLSRGLNQLRSLSAEEWMDLNTLLRKEFGDLLTMAIVRGWLRVDDKSSDDPHNGLKSLEHENADRMSGCVAGNSEDEMLPTANSVPPAAGHGESIATADVPETSTPVSEDTTEHALNDPRGTSAMTTADDPNPMPATQVPAVEEGVPQATSHEEPAPVTEDPTAAERAAEDCSEEKPNPWPEKVAGLVLANRVDLAYHLVRTLESHSITDGLLPDCFSIPSELLRALVLSQVVQASYDDAAAALEECYPVVLERLRHPMLSETPCGLRMMALAATLRPALLAPSKRTGDLLQSAKAPSNLSRVGEIVTSIRDLLKRGLVVRPEHLQGIEQSELWERQLAEVTGSIEDWVQQQRLSTINYNAATQVWHQLLERGPLADNLATALRCDAADAASIRGFVERQDRKADAQTAILEADKALRGGRAERMPIEARALRTLLNRYSRAVLWLRTWVELAEQRPPRQSDHATRKIQQARDRISGMLTPATAEVEAALSTALPNTYEAAGLQALIRCLRGLEQVFDPAPKETQSVPAIRHLLGQGLLAIRRIELDDNWHPSRNWAGDTVQEIMSLPAEAPDWWARFNQHLEDENYHAAMLLLELAEAGRIPAPDVGAKERLKNGLRDTRTALSELRKELLVSLERSVLDGVLDAAEMQREMARLTELDLDAETQLGRVRTALLQTRDLLERHLSDKIAKLRERIERSGLREASPRTFALIQERLKHRDVSAAHEYLYFAEHGETEFEREEGAAEFAPFHEALSEFEKLNRRAPPINPKAIPLVRTRKAYGPFSYRRVPPAQAKELVAGLDAWVAVRNSKRCLDDHVRTILQAAGFEVRSVAEDPALRAGESYCWMKLACDPIQDRSICPLPTFGSQAGGDYTVLCIWGRPLEGDILQYVQKAHLSGPLLCLFFGPMSGRRRRDLARAVRRARQPLLVLDEHLYLYILQWGQRSQRLRSFFHTAANYAVAEPYTTTSSYVAPEMFYGRNEELKLIADVNNHHLIYGGRQLGKTALLRQVAANYHQPSRGVIVLWIDLKHRFGIGTQKPIEDIWSVIADELKPFNVIPHSVTKDETICDRIQAWLEADAGRRIVLLLDEADEFLASDAGGSIGNGRTRRASWSLTQGLKNVAEVTHGRFKFVFSGLHNVQRTGCDPNSPVAHLGPSICIGPFLQRRELREAINMVKGPLGALGYSFAADSLIMRILAYANYYPSLIQLICKQLLEFLVSDAAAFDERTSPPYIIEERHIEGAYRKRELHKEIVNRLFWTLDLDNRYKVIALMVAYLVHVERDSRFLSEGIPMTSLRDEILSNQSRAFGDDITLDAFGVLLDEMVGLGVLRDAGDHRYTLRSSNILGLLGGPDQILELLTEALNQEPLPQYEAASFRRAVETDNAWRRSPLTAQQERELLDRSSESKVVVVYGSEASGVQDLLEFLSMAPHPDLVILPLSPLMDLESAKWEVDRAWDTGKRSLLVVVGRECMWNTKWLEYALERLKRRGRTERKLRFLFLVPPSWTFSKLKIPEFNHQARQLLMRVSSLSLRPWSEPALRWWLDDIRVTASSQVAKKVLAATGGWHSLVTELGKESHGQSAQFSKHLESMEEHIRDDNVRQQFEIPKAYQPVLHVFNSFREELLTPDEVLHLADGKFTQDLLAAAIEWGDRMCYLQPAGKDRWTLDPLVARVIENDSAYGA